MPQADRVTVGNIKKKLSGEKKNVIIVAYNRNGKEHIMTEKWLRTGPA